MHSITIPLLYSRALCVQCAWIVICTAEATLPPHPIRSTLAQRTSSLVAAMCVTSGNSSVPVSHHKLAHKPRLPSRMQMRAKRNLCRKVRLNSEPKCSSHATAFMNDTPKKQTIRLSFNLCNMLYGYKICIHVYVDLHSKSAVTMKLSRLMFKLLCALGHPSKIIPHTVSADNRQNARVVHISCESVQYCWHRWCRPTPSPTTLGCQIDGITRVPNTFTWLPNN